LGRALVGISWPSAATRDRITDSSDLSETELILGGETIEKGRQIP
jgi:hypothetical protein